MPVRAGFQLEVAEISLYRVSRQPPLVGVAGSGSAGGYCQAAVSAAPAAAYGGMAPAAARWKATHWAGAARGSAAAPRHQHARRAWLSVAAHWRQVSSASGGGAVTVAEVAWAEGR